MGVKKHSHQTKNCEKRVRTSAPSLTLDFFVPLLSGAAHTPPASAEAHTHTHTQHTLLSFHSHTMATLYATAPAALPARIAAALAKADLSVPPFTAGVTNETPAYKALNDKGEVRGVEDGEK